MENQSTDVDVLVVGGGPAGSTISTLLAREGLRVTVLEKDHHPRFHIGESLLPCNMPLIEELGVMDDLRRIGVVKLGADFSIATDESWRTYHFSRSLNPTPPNAYEVKRSEFDELLFRNAAKNGVTTVEGVTVTGVTWDDRGHSSTTAVTADGEHHTYRAKYFVDASGRDTLLSRKFDIKVQNKKHASAAIFGHFKGVTRRPGADQGNISIYWFDHGWMWFIPLKDDVMSVGAVCWPEYLKTRTGSTEDFLWKTLELAPKAFERMKNAELISEVRATGNYSYTSRRMSGPGYVMVGDAFAFIDPVFSSGVYLAMSSAKAGARVVLGTLRDRASEPALQREFDARVRKGIGNFSWFIYRFTSPAMRWIFKNPRNVLRLEEAVISMLAGDVFDSADVLRRFQLLRGVYAVRLVAELRESVANKLRRRRNAGTLFHGVTTAEGRPETVGFAQPS
jgi:flavin-dependent dehydrogenase